MEDKLYCKHKPCQEDWDEDKPDCLCGDIEYTKCKNYIGDDNKEPIIVKDSLDQKKLNLPWHSNAMGAIDIDWLLTKKQPIIIGILGQAETGKTTLLATLYMLLRNGNNIGEYTFAGSYTLLGWEKIAHFLSFHTHKKIHFPPHTSSNTARLPGLLHLLLKDKDNQYQDVLFTDAPGEWFTKWAANADTEEGKGARWIDKNADAFIIVADTEAFNEAVGKTRKKLLGIVERMKNTHKNRPTTLVWTKSDIKLEHPKIKTKITAQVTTNLTNIRTFETAVINRSSDDSLYSLINLVNFILVEKATNKNLKPQINTKKNTDDFFFLIR